MTRIERTIPAGVGRVFEVLADGWSYAGWVVGASHVRDVDPLWPAVGSRLHHSSGPWPLQVEDITIVKAMERDRSLELEARLWVFGKVHISLELTPVTDDSTRVVMVETATGGPAKLVPHPVQKLLFEPRNAEALARLADLASGRGASVH